MAINSTTDIHLAIEQLGLTGKGNTYVLDQSVPPHKITKWYSDNVDSQPTDDELNAAYTTWKNANEYKRNRENSYPSLQEQMDMQYWDSVNDTTNWLDHIAEVKENNPKPE